VADASRTVVQLGEKLDDDRLAAEFGGISGETMDAIPYEQTAAVEVYADVRFRGQSHELSVRVQRPSRAHIAERFVEAYRARYGPPPGERAIEIVTLRARRIGHRPELELPSIVREGTEALPTRVQIVDLEGIPVEARAITRAGLLALGPADGPILVIDPEATALIPAGWSAVASENGSIVVERRAAS